MRTYLISYDLGSDTARHRIATEIMRLGQAWARPLAATWYLRTDAEEADLQRRLRPWLDTDDGLLIQAVREEAVLLNTALRWFRQRRADDRLAGADQSNVVAFPVVGPRLDADAARAA